MIDTGKVPEEMVRFLRNSWETYLKILETVSSQTEKVLEIILNQTDALQSEGKQMFKQWLIMMKESQDQYKKMMEENLKKLESMVNKE